MDGAFEALGFASAIRHFCALAFLQVLPLMQALAYYMLLPAFPKHSGLEACQCGSSANHISLLFGAPCTQQILHPPDPPDTSPFLLAAILMLNIGIPSCLFLLPKPVTHHAPSPSLP